MSRSHDVCVAPSESLPEQAPPALLAARPNALAGALPGEAMPGREAASAALAGEPLGDFYYESFLADPALGPREALYCAYFGDWDGFERLLCGVYRAADAEAAAGSARAAELRALRAEVEAGLAAMRAQPTDFELDVIAGRLAPQLVTVTALFVRSVFEDALDGLLEELTERFPEDEGPGALRAALGEEGVLTDLYDVGADKLALNLGFAAQELSSVLSFGLADPLLDPIGDPSFQDGREVARTFDTLRGFAEVAAGLAVLAGAATIDAACLGAAALSGGALAAPAAGLAVTVDGMAVLVGGGLLVHGGATLMAGKKGGGRPDAREGQSYRRFSSSPVPTPEHLTAFPKARRVRGRGRARWQDPDGFLYEWDSLHGTIERYDRRGRHLGEFANELVDGNPVQLSGPVAGRRIDI